MSRTDDLLGKSGEAEIVSLFTARTNTDTEEGRGQQYDKTFHETERGAKLGTVRIGVMGTDGTVGERLAVRFSDGTLLLLVEPDPRIILTDEASLDQDVRKTALSKLTEAERAALGV